MKVSFWRRLAAYIIDIVFVSLLVTIICSALPEKKSLSKLELNSLETQLINGEIAPTEYIDLYKDLLYENSKVNILEISINLILIIGYFVVFQYMNKGQTLGKKLLKLRVVDKDSNQPITVLKGLFRTIIYLNIISAFVSTILINYLSKATYISIYLTLIEIENALGLLCITFIIFRKDGRGLHDLIVNTKVIEER